MRKEREYSQRQIECDRSIGPNISVRAGSPESKLTLRREVDAHLPVCDKWRAVDLLDICQMARTPRTEAIENFFDIFDEIGR